LPSSRAASVISQVVLSYGIPFALVPLVVLTSRAQIMGGHVNRRYTTICACACVVVIIAFNVLIVVHEA
jgi:manganese transport protein